MNRTIDFFHNALKVCPCRHIQTSFKRLKKLTASTLFGSFWITRDLYARDPRVTGNRLQ